MKFHDQRISANLMSVTGSGEAETNAWVFSQEGWFRRLRFEILIEVALIAFCLVWALTWTAKLGLAIAVLCLRSGLADFVTAYVVVRCDPDRWHGRALAALFISWGFLRAALTASVVLSLSLFALLGLQRAFPGNAIFPFLFVPLGTGLICVYCYLTLIFPFALLSCYLSWRKKLKISFASGLTKVRLSGINPRRPVKLDTASSLNRIALASGVSLSTYFIFGSLFLLAFLPQLGWISPFILLGCVTMPFLWAAVFLRTVH